MANEAQVELLKQGTDIWNNWKRGDPLIKPDLSGANLNGATLRGADLFGADLSGATLFSADLRWADLGTADLHRADLRWAAFHRADLRGANLSGANLSGAFLVRADLFGANLSTADLRGATLSRANLIGTDLRGANLSGSNLLAASLRLAKLDGADLSDSMMHATTFAETDLSVVKGLESVKHTGPSTIGIDTIYRSRAQIPEAFLRGAGVPEPFITNMQALVAAMEPIQFYSCFISYSSRDEDFAKRLHADLQREHVRCYFASEDLRIGEEIRATIDQEIHVHEKLLVVLSDNSLKSEWVKKEVETAFETERLQNRLILFPIRLDDAVMETNQAWAADIRRMRQIGDFRDWKDHDRYKRAFDQLLDDLKA